MDERILILDFGCPFKELIARRVRELNVYSEIKPGNISLAEIKRLNPIGIILTGYPDYRSLPKRLQCHPKLDTLGIPIIEIPNPADVTPFDKRKDRLMSFLFTACKASGDYLLDKTYINIQLQKIRQQVGKERVLLALSGGVDSSVCASLLSKAVPGQLACIFVDHGCMRLNEGDEIEEVFSQQNLQFIRVNAQDRFLARLKGVTDPETKRKRIGEEFIRVFEEEAKKLGSIPFLAQGTIYPDIVESGTEYGAVVKSHHNVGGLPKNMSFTELVEPLSGLFKDEVRKIGKRLGLPSSLVYRQPFPGPGLAVRVIGEVTKEKLDILRQADAIFREETVKLTRKPSQYFAILTDSLSVGIKGEQRTYSPVIALRAVMTDDFMSCEYMPIRHKMLRHIAERITQEVPAVSRVVYDITSKPPATVEWE